MMGQKDFTPKLFHLLSLSKLVPDGHLVRSLEEVLDISPEGGVRCQESSIR